MTGHNFHEEAVKHIYRVLEIIDDIYAEWSNNKIDSIEDVFQAIDDRLKELEDKTT